MDKVCVLVVSHNYPEITNNLCKDIIKNTKNVEYDLHVIETGSDLDKLSDFTTLWVKEGCRMTRGFNLLKQYADSINKMAGNDPYFSYMLFVNDAVYVDEEDLIGSLYDSMKQIEDCGQIHPYQSNVTSVHQRLTKMSSGMVRKESFAEIVCPMISAAAWDACGEDFLDNRFFYGWGLDYDIPHQLHQKGFRTYISDKVGIYHKPFTSYLNRDKTNESLTKDVFVNKARLDMHKGMIEKYGKNWVNVLANSIPEDVPKEALHGWLFANDGYRAKD